MSGRGELCGKGRFRCRSGKRTAELAEQRLLHHTQPTLCSSCPSLSATVCSMAEDLMLAAAQLTKVRRERLRELYHAEMTQYQKELAAKGLTIEVKIN